MFVGLREIQSLAAFRTRAAPPMPVGSAAINSTGPLTMMKTVLIQLSDIYVPAKVAKTLDPEKAEKLAEDILENGLQVPVQLRRDEERDRYVLVAGLHRLEATRLLGETTVESLIVQARKH